MVTHSEAMNLWRILDSLDVYKLHPPKSKEDWQEIIDAANKLLKAAGVK